ncbi:hypothetical protein BDK51DRAFT_47467 [Blyttiomyces helicus]|uniref:Transcription initiation factor TFIID subunit 1 histone acetyltransferase domain-containing protein n=1 Tax=Blyttiomyces helicus TaxID=388810 RepID=A0A4P9W7X5_9FUNG|nr:hypothetical protein BDK51DRAFT_47467 [Blyttiomyces helicus]|eukprot:RKO88494.1 hypothetical protein BDK51DRAFT_47467 [Blyttiomyces helicus]
MGPLLFFTPFQLSNSTAPSPCTFSRVRAIKKKKLKGKEPADVLRNPKDLTLKEISAYILLEYSEEYPPMMSNTGMATLMYNYYRKKDEKDPHVPEFENGGPYVLENVDASPFLGYGDVKPGETIQAVNNNMFRAPIFPHTPPSTDFLVVRNTFQGETRYFIREIPHLYVVGQIYPVTEVPRPQSRKITSTVKGRLQVVTFRYMNQDPMKRLRYEKLVRAFPNFSEPQLRQRLKEFAQFQKKGENTGWWKLKPKIKLPNEEEIRKIVTPEQVCLYESMSVGQRRLYDSGYSDMAFQEEERENEEEEASADIEVQLAPWTTTKNFVMATQGKGMLKLYGPGDPTGRGEAFSFIRASMKEMFIRAGETEEERLAREAAEAGRAKTSHRFSIADQQHVYKQEIDRIWQAQRTSLSSTVEPVDEEDDYSTLGARQQQMEIDEEMERRRDYGYSNPMSPEPLSPPAFDRGDGER